MRPVSVFAEGSEMEFMLKTDAISFPGSAKGLRAIEDILRGFNTDYENIYTFCLSRPSDSDRRHFACHWLVGMSAKSDGRPRGWLRKVRLAFCCGSDVPRRQAGHHDRFDENLAGN